MAIETMRILLTAEDFQSLIEGEIVEKKIDTMGEIGIVNKVHFCLQDIGYKEMLRMVLSTMKAKGF